MKKLIALALGLLISVSVVGCVGRQQQNITNRDTEIEISFWDSGYGREYMGIERSTFLIDPEGKICGEWRKVKVAGHALAVLDHLKSLKE